MLDAFRVLFANKARVGVWKIVTRKPSRRPAPVKGSEPKEHLHPDRCPRFPDGTPVGVAHGAGEHLLIAGLGNVLTRVRPPSMNRVRRVGKLNELHLTPQVDILQQRRGA